MLLMVYLKSAPSSDYPFRHRVAQAFSCPSEAADIKNVMQEYGETTGQQNAVGTRLSKHIS